MEKKEAMKILKDFYDKSALFSIRTALDTVIPELKESEDEKIRKAIRTLILSEPDIYEKIGFSQSDCLVWLEKKGEQNLANSTKTCKDEQKSAWSEADDAMRNFIALILRNHQSDEDFTTFKTTFKDCIDWFKSLKERVQPQNMWISVDKEVYIKEPVLAQKKDKSDIFKGYVICCDHVLVPNVYERYIRLGNYCPQFTWKPSKEQIMALRWVLNHMVYDSHKEEINGLLEQLLKLYNYGENR